MSIQIFEIKLKVKLGCATNVVTFLILFLQNHTKNNDVRIIFKAHQIYICLLPVIWSAVSLKQLPPEAFLDIIKNLINWKSFIKWI